MEESSRIHFEFPSLDLEDQVLGPGLEALCSRKLPVLGSRTALFFGWLKSSRPAEKFFSRPSFCGDRLTNCFEDRDRLKNMFGDRQKRSLAFVSLAIGLGPEHSSPWP